MGESLFDENGKLKDPDALASVQLSPRSFTPRTKVVDGNKVETFVNNDDGRLGGMTTTHPSGRVDVNVLARAAVAKVKR
jgi:hypothetical protein